MESFTFELSRKLLFDIQIPILTLAMSRKILFWHSKSYFDIRYESEKSYFNIHYESESPILTVWILFLNSHWVWKSYFDIQNPILTFALSRMILFWIRYEPENPILTSIILFWHSHYSENPFLTFKILFWHSLWVGKSFFDTQNSESYFDIRTVSENLILTF